MRGSDPGTGGSSGRGGPGGHGKRSFARLAALVGLALAAVLYWPLVTGQIPFPADLLLSFPPWESARTSFGDLPSHAEQGDLVTQFYPWRAFTAAAFRAGSVPQWNPHQLLGLPFLANPLNSVFYPLAAPYALLPFSVAWGLAFPLRTALAVLLAALLASRLGATTAGALAAGVVFACSGFLTTLQGYPEADTVLWLPAVFLVLDRLAERPNRGAIVLAGLTFGLTLLSGQIEIAMFVFAAGFLFWLVRLAAFEPSPRRWHRPAALAASAGLGLGVAAVQLLPTFLWLEGLARTSVSALPTLPLDLLRALLSRDLGSDPNSWGIPVPAAAVYAGVATLLFAPAALTGRRWREALPFALLLVVAFELLYGLPPTIQLFRAAGRISPWVQSLHPGYMTAFVDFALALLAGLGISALQRELDAPRPGTGGPRRAALAAVVAGVVVAIVLSALALGGAPFGGKVGIAAASLLAAASLVLVVVATSRRLPGRWFGRLALVLLAADLSTFAFGYVPFSTPRAAFPPSPVYDYLGAAVASAERVAYVDHTAPANVEMSYGLRSASGYDFAPRRTLALFDGLGRVRPNGVWLDSGALVASDDRRLDLFAVRYVLATSWNRSAANLAARPDRFREIAGLGSTRIFENRRALPPAFVVPLSGAAIEADDERALATLRDPGFDPERDVLLAEPLPRYDAAVRPPVELAEERVPTLRTTRESVEIDVVSRAGGVLVISQTFDRGWSAELDGKPLELRRADLALTAAVVPPGRHRVALRYRAPGLRVGASVSLLALATCCLVARRRRPAREPAGARAQAPAR